MRAAVAKSGALLSASYRRSVVRVTWGGHYRWRGCTAVSSSLGNAPKTARVPGPFNPGGDAPNVMGQGSIPRITTSQNL